MKLTATRTDLLKALGAVTRVIERRNTIPILSNALLAATSDHLIVAGTDLDLRLEAEVPATIIAPGSVTVPAATLHDIARKLPDGALVEIEAREHDVVVKAGRSRFVLQALPASDFPEGLNTPRDSAARFALPAETLLRLINRVSFAISTEETRYYLNGIYLHECEAESGPVLRAVATDGHRLARADLPLPEGAAGMPGVIVPRKMVGEMARLADSVGKAEITLAIGPAQIKVEAPGLSLTSKLIDGTFPDYARVIPAGDGAAVRVKVAELRDSLARVATISSEKGRAVKLTFEDGLIRIEMTANADGGSGMDEIAAEMETPPPPIGMNPRYAVDLLDVMGSDAVTIRMADPGSPMRWEPEGDASLLTVLMPMRV